GVHDVRVLLIVRSQAEPVLEEDLATAKGEKVTKALAPLLTATLQDVTATPSSAPQQPPGSASGTTSPASKSSEGADSPAVTTDLGSDGKDSVAKKHGPAALATAQIIASA